MRLLNKAAVVGSGVLMIHATICAIQHRTYLKAVQQPFEYPPLEIAVQCILALALGMWGMIGLAGNFVPIRTTTHLSKQTVDSLDPSPDFVHFKTRQLRR